jgi:four helix bundle protein
MASYRDLWVWQEAMNLVASIYKFTAAFPVEERYSLVQQMRRAAVSIPSNIAEGHGRRTLRQRYNFLENAVGSVFELETQVELAGRLGFLQDSDTHTLSETIRSIGRGLHALMRYVEKEAGNERRRT